MTTLWELIAPLVQGRIVEPPIQALLDGVGTTLTDLGDQAQDAGTATAKDVWAVIAGLLPLPPGIPPPLAFPVDLAVSARRFDAGWEVSIELPTEFRIELPPDQPFLRAGELDASEEHIDPQSLDTPIAVVVSAPTPGTAPGLQIRSENGPDVDARFSQVSLRLDPTTLALPFGFGVRITAISVGPTGVGMPDMDIFLPRLPRLPTGDIRCPVSFKRIAGQLAGIAAKSGPIAFTPPWAGAGVTGFVEVSIDRPAGRTLADLLPTAVTFDVPLESAPISVPGKPSAKAQAAGGGGLRLQGTLTTTESGASISATVVAAGSERGIAVVPATDEMGLLVALVGALGPYLQVPGASDGATFEALVGGAALLTSVVAEADAQTTLQAAHLTASWNGASLDPADVHLAIDYESQFGIAVGVAAIKASTRPGGPVRIRNRGVTVHLDGTPRLSWVGATTTLVSPGDWNVDGIPDGLLRVAGVRGGQGSLTLDLDLRVSLELGVVTVDQTTVRVTIDANGAAVGPAGFGVGIDIPGTLTGRGQLAFRDPGFEAALAVRLPSLGAAGKAVVHVEGSMVMIGIQVSLFAPIPFANSGLGLFGIEGLLAANSARNIDMGDADPITRELAWDPLSPAAWRPGDNVFIGFGATIGTVPDLGFAVLADASILLGLPDPMLRVALEAQLMRGALRLLGILVVNPDELTIALHGQYGIDHLLEIDAPAGATFPFTDLTRWNARLGGDRDGGRGEPVTLHILPDLLDIDAWGFLMAFGNISTVVGAKLAPPGSQLDGLSLAVGAGVEIRWSAGIFVFEASGTVLAVITHRPPPPGSTDRPWMLVGAAKFSGAVDLGPVSIGASAHLDAILVPTETVFYGRAEACAKVDLWLTSLEGCVHLDIGKKPSGPVPEPDSPLLRVVLTDRTGLVVGTAEGDGGPIPTVWPDAVPVVCFSHWVAQAPGYRGTTAPIGNSAPSGNGWVGTKKLEYRFELMSVRAFEIVAGGARTEVGTGWNAAWQLPLSANVYAGTAAPAEARSLALNSLDPHLYLQPAVNAGAGFPGDPIALLGTLCQPVPPASRVWFPGELAAIPWAGPMTLPPRQPPLSPDDLGDAVVTVADPNLGELDEVGVLEALALSEGSDYFLPFVEARAVPVGLDGEQYSALCWLPLADAQEMRPAVVVALQQPAVDAIVFTAAAETGIVDRVSDPLNGDWTRIEKVTNWDGLTVEAWASPPGKMVDEFHISFHGFQPVGLVTFGATSAAASERAAANEGGRRQTQNALEAASTTAVSARSMLKAGTSYEVDVELQWSGRSDSGEYASESSQPLPTRTFRFQTAPKKARPAPVPIGVGGRFEMELFMRSSAVAGRLFDEHVLQEADLQRYIGGAVPPDGTLDHLCDDPVQVLFMVDHLPQLAAVYDDKMTVVVRRTDAPPGTPPEHAAPQITPVPPPVAGDTKVVALGNDHLTSLDQARARFMDTQDASDSPCRIRRPGGAVQPPLVLDPEGTYALEVTIDGAGLQTGSGVVIHSTVFRTSRYRNGLSLLADLGLRDVSPPTPLPALPLGAAAFAAVGPLAAAGESIGEGYAAALDDLGIGGYDPPTVARTSVLWVPDAAGTWQVFGVLLEVPEPLSRTGRLEVGELRLAGEVLKGRHWDARQTRLLAMTNPFVPAGPAALEMSVHDRPPGQPDSGPTTLKATIDTVPPTLAGVLR